MEECEIRGGGLKSYQDGKEARAGIGSYFRFYDNERPHQAYRYWTPAEVYLSSPVEANDNGLIESTRLDTPIAGSLGKADPILT